MDRYKFIRDEDESGVSGTGHVADAVEFDNGKTVLCWRGSPSSVSIYESIQHLIEIHGHDGKAYLEPIDQDKSVITDVSDK